MFKSIAGAVGLFCIMALAMLLVAKPATAQQSQDYYTYVSEWAVPRAQWAAFEQQDESSIATMKKTVADGMLVSWGNVAIRVHQADGFTHAEWFTATSRENLLKVLEGQWKSATNDSYTASTKHVDLLLHAIAYGGKSGEGSGYLRVSSFQAKPGDDQALEGLMMKDVKPFLESALANGTVTGYSIDTEDIHTGAPGGYDIAMVFPDGAAMDKFYSDLAAAGRSDPTFADLLASVTVDQDHRDSLGRVTAYENK